MKIRLATHAAAAALLLLAGALAACDLGRPLLSGVKVTPSTIAPNGDGNDDVASISYVVGANRSLFSITLLDEQGRSYPLRSQEPRSAGDYYAQFSGVVETSVSVTPFYAVTQAAVLPDGPYKVRVEVENGANRQTVESSLSIRGGDASAPGFGDFSVFTPSFDEKFQATRGDRIVFSPNRDGIGDRVAVSYWLSKEATVEVYLVRTDDPAHAKYPIAPVSKLKPGRHDHDYEGGVDLGNTPPPNGEYLVVGEAKDAIGNHAVTVRPLTITDGGVPLAQIISSSITPTSLPLNGLLRIEVTVENVGTVAIRSQGPYSGTVYTTEENYNTKGFYDNPGVFRIGADFEGNTAGRQYPFRWGFAGDRLSPGERQTVVGYIKITSVPSKSQIYFWTGLQHEQVRVVNDKVMPKLITIGF